MHKRDGFTIVELLIVIVIIAILAAITIVAFNGARLRGQATVIANDFKSIEKAMNLYKVSTGQDTWLVDTDPSWNTTTAGNPSLNSIIANNAIFSEYMRTAPVVKDIGTSTLFAYDNDGDTYGGCAANSNAVNIYIPNVTNQDLARAVDNAIDDNDLGCGKMRMAGTSLHYNISRAP